MSRLLTALAITAVLAGCDGENPFMVEVTSPTGETETLEPGDPNTEVSNKFLFDTGSSLTMNSVEYDAVNNVLVINNLPFDGTLGRYDSVAGSETTDINGVRREIYESRQTLTTGLIKHYAVFIDGSFLEATAAAGRDWGNFGNAGANINRSSFNLPDTAETEYVYVGVYAGTRTFDERSGIELITGNVRLLLDMADFDPNGEFEDDIIGSVTDRVRVAPELTGGGDLPNISLFEVSYDPQTGSWDDGISVTLVLDSTIRDNGTHSGLIAGDNG